MVSLPFLSLISLKVSCKRKILNSGEQKHTTYSSSYFSSFSFFPFSLFPNASLPPDLYFSPFPSAPRLSSPTSPHAVRYANVPTSPPIPYFSSFLSASPFLLLVLISPLSVLLPTTFLTLFLLSLLLTLFVMLMPPLLLVLHANNEQPAK